MTTATKKPPVKLVQNGKNVEVHLKRVRLSFVDVFAPIQGKDDKGNPTERFYVSTNALLDKNTEEGKAQIAAVKEAMKLAREAEWGDSPPKFQANHVCLQDGEPVDATTGEKAARWEGYEGHMYISANKTLKATTLDEAKALIRDRHPVQILGPRKTARDANGNPMFPVLKESDGLIYSGCWADVILQVYPYNAAGKSHPSRINASLEAIKFVDHGKPFGGKSVDAQSAFDEEDDDQDDTEEAAPAPKPAASDDPFGD